ncbi:hypothetical protein HDU93_007138 [Gonapodya sp. JEL0774]|nr:hypothetical protein HDU93_007138 [Gonapodya sp. JEL0774]
MTRSSFVTVGISIGGAGPENVAYPPGGLQDPFWIMFGPTVAETIWSCPEKLCAIACCAAATNVPSSSSPSAPSPKFDTSHEDDSDLCRDKDPLEIPDETSEMYVASVDAPVAELDVGLAVVVAVAAENTDEELGVVGEDIERDALFGLVADVDRDTSILNPALSYGSRTPAGCPKRGPLADAAWLP